MSRDANGNYTLPSGNPVQTGTIIQSSWANTTLPDLGFAMTDSLSRSGLGAMQAFLRLIDGTKANPAVVCNSDLTAGRYLAAVGDMREAVGGTDIVRYTLLDGIEYWDSIGAQWLPLLQVASDIPYDNSGTPLISDNLQDSTSEIANTYAPLDSPDLINVPTAPTALPGDSTTQIATTEFVITNGGGGGFVNSVDPGDGLTNTGDVRDLILNVGAGTGLLVDATNVSFDEVGYGDVRYAQLDANNTFTGDNIVSGTLPLIQYDETDTGKQWFSIVDASQYAISENNTSTIRFKIDPGGNVTIAQNLAVDGIITAGGSTVWTAGNDGAASGLDADLLDGKQGALYGLLAANQTWEGLNTFNDTLTAAVALSTPQISGITDTSVVTNLNADLLDGQEGTYYRNAGNLNAGTLLGARFNDSSHGNRSGGSLHADATTSVDGFMSSTDKTKLDGIAGGSEVNQNAFSNVAVSGQSTIIADQKTDTLNFANGTGITITTNNSTDTATITNSSPNANQNVVAGTGMTGGGSGNTTTLNVIAGTGISVAANSVSFNTTYGDGRYLGLTNQAADSDKLNGQLGSYYRNAGNINAGTLAVSRGGTGVTSSTGTGSTVRSASPTLTGNPIAPTQTTGNDSTRIATTAFVQDAVVAGGGGFTVTSTGSNSNGYYRIWSDGFTEQWGVVGAPAYSPYNTTDDTFTFPLAYSTLDGLTVVNNIMWTFDQAFAPEFLSIVGLTTTNVTFGGTIPGRHWYSKGY